MNAGQDIERKVQMIKAKPTIKYTKAEVRAAAESLVRKGLAVKRWDSRRGTHYVAIDFASDEERIAAQAPSNGSRDD
jgi:hypothetical protein